MQMIILILILILVLLCGSVKGGNEFTFDFKTLYSRQLGDDQKPWAYPQVPEYGKIMIKHGQRKLLFNELEFYTAHLKPGETVIYAGAANGRHNIAIAELFPKNKFILFDTNEFYEGLNNYTNIELQRHFFTETDCKTYKGCVFICDIRTASDGISVHEDMLRQYEWCRLMQPRMAMLKFRLPYFNHNCDYFDGKIYTQPRVGPSSTETRLWTDCKTTKNYNYAEYNSRCFNFNINNRPAYYNIDNYTELAKDINGLDHCYDCWSEIEICRQYLAKYPPLQLGAKYYGYHTVTETHPIAALMNFCGASCLQFLDVPPHGLLPNEKDILKKMKILEEYTVKYVDKTIDKYAPILIRKKMNLK